jgi:hypothetical protein
MKVLGIRFCTVTPEAEGLATFLDALGLGRVDPGHAPPAGDGFPGAVFPAGEHSWIEAWAPVAGMPEGTMLQIVVDDADAFAAHARSRGLDPQGPMDAQGERIYFLAAPSGLAVSLQSRTAP